MNAAAALAADPYPGVRRDARPDDHHIVEAGRDDRAHNLLVDDHRRRGLPYLTTVPDCEPPYDDERRRPADVRPGSRPVAAGDAGGPTRNRTANRGATATAKVAPLVHSTSAAAWSEEADIGGRPTTTAELPAAERSASVLARALIEVLSGHRPVGQLRVHCAPDVYAGLAGRPTFASTALPHLVSVRVCEPADGVAEVSVTYRRAERVRALAFRMQGVDGRWRMTALQLC